MPVIKKVQSKVSFPLKAVEETEKDGKAEEKTTEISRPKKVCQFCKGKIEPKYWDVVTLRRFLNDRGRIVSRGRGGCCAKHQRRISREIKRARHLGLLPFTIQV